jgi:hypothetical protein
MLLRRFCDICTVMMLTCQTSIKRFMSSIRDLFFSYVISLFLLMIFVFDLTNPYWNKYLREKNITWFSTNYHVIIMSCEKKQIFICKAFIFIFILLVIKWEWFFKLYDIWIVTWRSCDFDSYDYVQNVCENGKLPGSLSFICYNTYTDIRRYISCCIPNFLVPLLHHLIKFVSDLRQVSGFFLWVLWFPSPIKLTSMIYLKYCWKWH